MVRRQSVLLLVAFLMFLIVSVVSNPIPTVVAEGGSDLSIQVSPTPIALGETLSVMGTLTPHVVGTAILLTFARPNGSIITGLTYTDSDGNYMKQLAPDIPGNWGVQAYWGGLYHTPETWSPEVDFEVTQPIPEFPGLVVMVMVALGISSGLLIERRSKKQHDACS